MSGLLNGPTAASPQFSQAAAAMTSNYFQNASSPMFSCMQNPVPPMGGLPLLNNHHATTVNGSEAGGVIRSTVANGGEALGARSGAPASPKDKKRGEAGGGKVKGTRTREKKSTAGSSNSSERVDGASSACQPKAKKPRGCATKTKKASEEAGVERMDTPSPTKGTASPVMGATAITTAQPKREPEKAVTIPVEPAKDIKREEKSMDMMDEEEQLMLEAENDRPPSAISTTSTSHEQRACEWGDCTETLDGDTAFIAHMDIHIKNQTDGVCMWKSCDRAAEQKPFTAPYMLNLHARRHTGDRPHVCTVSV